MAADDSQSGPSSFLFPSVVSKVNIEDEVQGNADAVQQLTGFSSFKTFTKENNDCEIVKDRKATEDAFSDIKSSVFQPKRTRESTSDLSDSGKRKEYKKQKKKKKKKKSKTKRKIHHEEAKPDTIWLEEALMKTDENFRIDRRCDKENLKYDSLYRLDITAYNRGADIRCLGLTRKQDFKWTDQRSKKKKIKNKKLSMRYFDFKYSDIQANGNDSDDEYHDKFSNISSKDDFVPLTKSFLRTKSDAESTNHGTFKSTDYYKIGDFSHDIEFSRKTEYYNEKLRENPHDVVAWLEFVKMQDNAFLDVDNDRMSSSFSSVQTSSKREKVIMEKKLDILDKALTRNPSSVQLIIEFMRYSREITDSGDVLKKWNDFIFRYPNKGLLWQEYLIFVQSDLSKFSMQNTFSAYWKSIKTLSAIRDGSFKSHQPEIGCSEDVLKIFLQYCLFLLQSDQSEKVIATMQAMIEFNCFVPDNIKSSPISVQKEFFEAFWDSETARFGENGALGWNNWMSSCNEKSTQEGLLPDIDLSSLSSGFVAEHTPTEDIIHKNLPKHKIWLQVEKQREDRYWKPWKQNENPDEECEDPDLTVLSDDVIPYLFKIDNEVQLQQLFLIFFVVLGVPIKIEFFSQYMKEKLLSVGLLSYQLKLFVSSDDTSLIFYNKTDLFEPQRRISVDLPESRQELIHNVLSQSFHVAYKHSNQLITVLSHCWLIFELILLKQHTLELDNRQLKNKKKSFRKFAKSLLKLPANRSNFELWELFANFEFEFGTNEEAFRIYDMIISMCVQQSSNGCDLSQFSKVFRNYSSFLMLVMEQEKSRKLSLENKLVNLLSLLSKDIPTSSFVISNEKINPLRLRKARSAFREIYSMSLDKISANRNAKDSEQNDDILELILCYVIFEYFTTDMPSAIDIIDQLERDIYLSESQKEKIANLRIFLCKHNFLIYHTQLLDLQKAVWGSVTRFPDKQRFYSILMEIEGKSFYNSLKIRRFFHQILQNTNSIYPWIFAILYEQMKHEAMKKAFRINNLDAIEPATVNKNIEDIITVLPSSGIINRLRSLYQRAVATQVGRNCVTLWRSYIHFEVDCGNLKRAKNIFYQALQNCPWVKVIYLDAIGLFPEDFDDILDMMQEKEIRIRLPVEEIDIMLED